MLFLQDHPSVRPQATVSPELAVSWKMNRLALMNILYNLTFKLNAIQFVNKLSL